eukprot:scaffold120761_cov73-Attheya_sp.AAC.1
MQKCKGDMNHKTIISLEMLAHTRIHYTSTVPPRLMDVTLYSLIAMPNWKLTEFGTYAKKENILQTQEYSSGLIRASPKSSANPNPQICGRLGSGEL